MYSSTYHSIINKREFIALHYIKILDGQIQEKKNSERVGMLFAVTHKYTVTQTKPVCLPSDGSLAITW